MKIFFILFILFSLPSFSEEENVMAKVNGVAIYQNDLNNQINWLKVQLKNSGQDLSKIPEEIINEQALNSLIEMEVVFQDAKVKKISVKKEEVQNKFDEYKKRFKEEKNFNDYLKKNNLNENKLKKEIERELILSKYIDEVILKDLKPVSDQEINKFYNDNPKFFIRPENVRASHILISVPENATDAQKKEAKKKADGILKELKNGANFEDLAKEKSDCPSKERGGDLGNFPRGKMVKPFEDAAFSLKPGTLSDVVETKFGYHIILVKEHNKEEKFKLEEVKEKIKYILEEEKKKELYRKKIEELLPKAKIEILTETKEHKH